MFEGRLTSGLSSEVCQTRSKFYQKKCSTRFVRRVSFPRMDSTRSALCNVYAENHVENHHLAMILLFHLIIITTTAQNKLKRCFFLMEKPNCNCTQESTSVWTNEGTNEPTNDWAERRRRSEHFCEQTEKNANNYCDGKHFCIFS